MLYSVKILVVDDTPTNLEVITETLSTMGYEIATAISGERALKRLQTYIPDLILLDVQMPGIDGFETCEQIKANPATAAIPIIFMTVIGDIDSKVKAFDLGAVDYITKPFHETELIVRVRTHLQVGRWNKILENRVAESTRELQIALEKLKQSQLQVVQLEKMSAIGNLINGIAHEINTPLGLLNRTIQDAQGSVEDLLSSMPSAPNSNTPGNPIDVAHISFLSQDLPLLLATLQSATDRIQSISNSLQIISANTEYQTNTSLHEILNSAVLMLRYRLIANAHRPAIQVIQQYGEVSLIGCFPGQLNQVFMSILANAIDRLDDAAQDSPIAELATPTITIQTTEWVEPHRIEIRVRDNGKPITSDAKATLFDHPLTDQGSGLGLAIARQIVVENHGGEIAVYSTTENGTEFIVKLPIH